MMFFMPMMMGWWGYGWPMMAAWAYWLVSAVAVIWALIDIARAKKDVGYKLIWTALVVVLGIIGALIYWLVEKKRR